MKTAEEILSEWDLCAHDTQILKDIQQIQLDAMREGMRRATDMACEYTVKVDRDAILSAAEQLTEKGL